MNIRRGTADDVRALAALRWRWRNEERNEPGGEREAFLDFFAAWVIDHWDTHLPFIADVDGQLSGMAWLMLAERVPSPMRPARPMGDLQSVYVVPEVRNSGVGAVLIGAILEEARERRFEMVTVHAAERAVPFYLRCGFKDGQRWLEWRP